MCVCVWCGCDSCAKFAKQQVCLHIGCGLGWGKMEMLCHHFMSPVRQYSGTNGRLWLCCCKVFLTSLLGDVIFLRLFGLFVFCLSLKAVPDFLRFSDRCSGPKPLRGVVEYALHGMRRLQCHIVLHCSVSCMVVFGPCFHLLVTLHSGDCAATLHQDVLSTSSKVVWVIYSKVQHV